MTVASIARELDVPRRTVADWLRGGSPGRRRIAIDRRGEVAKLDSFVGPKR
jgi:hypothetical protein